MGCNEICKAKKKAKKAKKAAEKEQLAASAEAAAAQKSADSAIAAAKGGSTTVTIQSYSVEVVTIAKYLGIDKKRNALSIREMQTLLKTAGKSPEIMAQAAAKNLVRPISTAMKAYEVLDFGRKVFQVVKPGIKIVSQLNDVATCNFAAVGELISDIAQFILQLLIGFAPLLIEILKNLFLDIPLYTKIITKDQNIVIQKLLNLSQINVRQRISDTIKKDSDIGIKEYSETDSKIKEVEDTINLQLLDYSIGDDFLSLEDVFSDIPYFTDLILDYVIEGFDGSKKEFFQKAIEEVEKEKINILEIPDIAGAEIADKIAMKSMMDGLLTVTKKVELAEVEELLRRNFGVSQKTPTEEGERFIDKTLAEATAKNILSNIRKMLFLAITSFNNSDGSRSPSLDFSGPLTTGLKTEIEKKLKTVEGTRQDIITVGVVEELMQSNKIQILRNVVNSLKEISFDPNDYSLNDCISENINNDFNNLKSTIISDTTNTINAASPTNEAEMIVLRDEVYNEALSIINDELIVIDDTCNFLNQVCDIITQFKSDLVLSIEKNLFKTKINVAIADVPDYIEPLKLKNMVDLFNKEINKEISSAARTIVLEDILPCKSCKPCEQVKAELDTYSLKRIEQIKDEMLKNSEAFILGDHDWSDSLTIPERKTQLINLVTQAANKNAGIVDLYDRFIHRLKQEETELLNSINTIIKNL